MKKLQSLIDLCKGRRVYIQTHNFPDPDAIASAFGLQRFLEIYGVESELCYDGKIDKLSASRMMDAFGIRMFPYAELEKDMLETDPIVCVDAQKHAGNITNFVGDEVACIDHHPTVTPVEYKYKDVRLAGACASLVADYFARSGNVPDPDTATALLYGMKMDTLQFSRGVTELDIDMFRFLFPYHDEDKLRVLETNNLELGDLNAYAAAISSIELYGKAGFAWVPFAVPDAMIGILSDFVLSLVEVDTAIVCSFREDGAKLSVRSYDPAVHAGNLIRKALEGSGSGGGHAAMGGGFVTKDRLPVQFAYRQHFIRERFLGALGITEESI